MSASQWPPYLDRGDREWTAEEQALWSARYDEIVRLGWKNAPKSVDELVNNNRIIEESVPREHRGYFTRVLLTNELMVDLASRVIALEGRQ